MSCTFSIPTFRIKDIHGIFIRNCYSQIFELLFNKKNDQTNAILCGNPGTGKTFFGYYAIYRLMSEDRSFFYEPIGNNDVWMYCSTSMMVILKKNIDSQLECIKTTRMIHYKNLSDQFVHIIDGHEPPLILPFRTVLICSPHEKHYSEFRKHMSGYTMLYMPTWDYSEIELCRNIFFNLLPETLVKQLFERWGGIARDVLNQPNALYGNSITLLLYFCWWISIHRVCVCVF